MPVKKRRFPYPYKALLAVSSDADATSPWEFVRIHRFLNTLAPAIPYYGDCVGLDIGDSFFFKNISNNGSSVYDACYRYKSEDAWADELNGTSPRIRTSTLLNFLSNSSILARLSEPISAFMKGSGKEKARIKDPKMLEIRSLEDWFSKMVPTSSKNTFAAGGSTYYTEVTGTGRSLLLDTALPTGPEKMVTIIWSGWLGGDFKLRLSLTTRPLALILAYRTNHQREESQDRLETCRVHWPIGLTTPDRRASSFIGHTYRASRLPTENHLVKIRC